MENMATGCGIPESKKWRSMVFTFRKWWPHVNRTTLRADLLAGLTGAVVALPQGVAFATIAGMPPEYGLYTGMIPAIADIFQRLDRSVCSICERRIFIECNELTISSNQAERLHEGEASRT